MSADEKIQSYFLSYPAHVYKKGEVLIQAGDTPATYYITRGHVSQYDIAKNGSKLVVNIYKPGSFISLASILNNIPSVFFFETIEPTTVHVAPSVEVANFLKENPDVTYDALARMSRGSVGLMLRLARAMEGSAEGRILQELLIMRSRFSQSKQVIYTTDTDLAAKTGLARETVSRTLKKLDAEGVVHSSRGKVTLSDSFHI